MKTSNKILISLFVLCVLWLFAAFFTAKSKVIAAIGNPSYSTNNSTKEIENINIQDFSHILLKGEGTLIIKKSNIQSISTRDKKNLSKIIRNDTLFLTTQKEKYTINVSNLRSIQTKGEVLIQIRDFETDILRIDCMDKSRVNITNLTFSSLKIVLHDKSKAYITKLKGESPVADLSSLDNSILNIGRMKDVELILKKDKNAKLTSY